MNVHCCLPSIALSQVERALPPPHRVSSSPDWNVAIAKLRDPACDAILVDPTAGSDRMAGERLAAIASTLATAQGTPIIGYVPVTTAAIKAAHRLARLGASEIVVRGLDDTAVALRATVQRVVMDHAAARLVTGAPGLLAGLPTVVADAIAMLFARPERTRSVADLARAAGTTRRTLDRLLARAGLAPARTLLSCARAHAAYRLLAAGGVRPSGVASLVGYASPRALTREFRALTGDVPSAVPSRLTSERFVASVSRRLMRGAAR